VVLAGRVNESLEKRAIPLIVVDMAQWVFAQKPHRSEETVGLWGVSFIAD
jgi:hypothetical protein